MAAGLIPPAILAQWQQAMARQVMSPGTAAAGFLSPTNALAAWQASQPYATFGAAATPWTAAAPAAVSAAPSVAGGMASAAVPTVMGSTLQAAPTAALPNAGQLAGQQWLAAQAGVPVTGGASGLTSTAANTAAQGGLLSRLFPAGSVTRAGLLKGAGYAGAGLLAGSLVNKANLGGEGSNWDQAASGAVTGAGIGAGIGTAIPIPGIGTGAGALIGGGLGALIGLFGPKQHPYKDGEKAATAEQSRIGTLMSVAGLDANTQNMLWQQYALALAGARDDKGRITKDQVQALDQSLVQSIQGMMVAKQQETMAALAGEKQLQNNMGLMMMALAGGPAGTRLATAVPQLQSALSGRLANAQSAVNAQSSATSNLAQLLQAG